MPYPSDLRRTQEIPPGKQPGSPTQIIGTKISAGHLSWRLVSKPCVFCSAEATLTNAHVLSQPIRSAFSDPSVTGSFVYRQSRQADGSHAAHSHSGSWVDVKARAECTGCNAGWTRQIEESVSLILPKLIHGQQIRLSVQDQQALASWSVVTVLLLQHTHSRAAQLVIPASDYAGVYEAKSPTAQMKVFTGYLEPPGRGARVEASAGIPRRGQEHG